MDARDIQPEDGETVKSDSYLKKLADRGASKLLEQLRTGSIEMTLDADGLEPGDVCFCSLPELGYKATSGWPTSSFRARPTAPPAPRGWVHPSGTRSRRR